MKYICSKNYKILCKESCYHVKNIKSENAIWFNTVNEGLKYGCRPCKHCMPEEKKGELIMHTLLNDLHDAIQRVQAYDYQPVNKIKVTSEFAHYLQLQCDYRAVDTSSGSGITGEFVGIPLTIDDEIENEYYELVF